MLVPKEIIRDGTYWYVDEATNLPRKLVVTPELRKHWYEQGNKMLGLGLPVPVPYEHDFTAHPMTPKEKLLNNAGEVKEYRNDSSVLSCIVDVTDPDVKSKIGHSIRWTSPWISSFTDGDGRQWNNVISHLALTTRPRVTKQAPFTSVAAALSMASETSLAGAAGTATGAQGFCLSRAGRISVLRETRRTVPRYPVAFSMYAGSIPLSDEDMPSPKKKDKAKGKDGSPSDAGETGAGEKDTEELFEDSDAPADGGAAQDKSTPATDDYTNPLADATGDVKMEEVLCHLLQALGVPMPDGSSEHEFKRHLYEAAMCKVKELTSKGMAAPDKAPDQNLPPDQQPHANQPNPLIQQEQQPMFMSIEDINKTFTDPTMKAFATAMHKENAELRARADADKKVVDSLRDARLKEATAKRAQRIAILAKQAPAAKKRLEETHALPAMALSIGDGGTIVDPMEQMLAVLDEGLANLPLMLTREAAALSVAPQPTDETMLSQEREDELAEAQAKNMGCKPKKAG